MERRLLLLPIVWALYGVFLAVALQYLLGPIEPQLPYNPNDKPIGGSVLPILFLNVASILGVVLFTLYSVGFWKPDLSSNRAKVEVGSVGVFLLSGFMAWYSAVFFFTGVAAVVALMAVSID